MKTNGGNRAAATKAEVPFSPVMSIHYRAMEHLAKAKVLMESEDGDSLRYAALELRYCIEHLFYRLAEQYKNELPDDVFSGKIWRPADIIAMITELDPHVERDMVLRFGFESAPGVPAKQMHTLGRQSGLSRALLQKTYHALGFYLHARVDQKDHDSTRLRRKLLKLLPYLEKFEGDRVITSGFFPQVSFACQICGRTLVKRARSIAENPYLECGRCGCVYVFEEKSEGITHKLLEHNVKCQDCEADNWIPHHELKRGAEQRSRFTCSACGSVFQMSPYIQFSKVSPEPAEPSTAG